jgi:hypothetical protein
MQVEQISRALERRANEPVFLWQHHPPVSLVPGYLPDNDFLIEDDSVLVNRHEVRGISVGHVHSEHNAEFCGIPLHATPSTFMGAPGPGYRIFDFSADGFTTEIRAFPGLMSLDDEARTKLRDMSRQRAAEMMHVAPVRNDEARARLEVLEWRHAADEARGFAPAF